MDKLFIVRRRGIAVLFFVHARLALSLVTTAVLVYAISALDMVIPAVFVGVSSMIMLAVAQERPVDGGYLLVGEASACTCQSTTLSDGV